MQAAETYISERSPGRGEMYGISVRQPWASYIAMGRKTVLHRAWETDYRGELLISSAERPDDWYSRDALVRLSRDLGGPIPLGAALCVATLTDCRPFEEADLAPAMMDSVEKGFALVFSAVRPIERFSVKSHLGLYIVRLPARGA